MQRGKFSLLNANVRNVPATVGDVRKQRHQSMKMRKEVTVKRRRFNSLVGGTILGSLAGPLACLSGCASRPLRDVDWGVSPSDENSSVDTDALRLMADRLGTSGANIHSVLVVQRGKLIFEQYFTGTDQVPLSFLGTRDARVSFNDRTIHSMKSVSKSVTSLALGIAIDQGLIHGIDEPILGFFPELADMRTPEREGLRLRHALTMTMGLQWTEATPATGAANDETRMYLSGDACRYVLNRPFLAKPGQQFLYSTGALSLVSAIMHKATGQPLDEFARVNLFSPLGITDAAWTRIGLDTDAGGGLYLRPEDMARIGQLVLDRGRWRGHQIVSKAWIDASTSPQVVATNDQSYGYLWWIGRANVRGRKIDWIGALGRGGQSIRIVPELDLVVVVTAGYYQDYSAQAFKQQYSVFEDVLRATLSPA